MKLYNIKNQKYIVYSLHKLTIFTTEWKDNTTAQNMADSTPLVYLNFDAMYVISQPTDLSPERYRILVDWYCGIKALWTSNGKKGSVKWRCEHAQSRGFLGNFVNLHNATS